MSHRLIFFGSGTFGLPALEALSHCPDSQLVAIVTQPPKPTGRGQRVLPTAIAAWAQPHALPLLTPESLKPSSIADEIRAYQADTFIVAAYGLILPPNILVLPRFGCLNIHASLLPKYRGASPIPAALLAGEPETGITFMLMDEHLDTGHILRAVKCPISLTETADVLHDQLADLAGQHLEQLLADYWSGSIQPVPQTGPSTYASKVTKSDGYATWQSGIMLERKIRAFTPWPGVWTTWQGTNIRLMSARFLAGHPASPMGTVEKVPDGLDWGIACIDGWLIPSTVLFAGKRPQPASSIPGSYPGFLGARLPS